MFAAISAEELGGHCCGSNFMPSHLSLPLFPTSVVPISVGNQQVEITTKIQISVL